MPVKRGFTLVELVIVMGLISVLAGFFYLNFSGQTRKARDAKRREDLNAYRGALELYANSNNGTYLIATSPTNLTSASNGCLGLNTATPPYIGACLGDPTQSGTTGYRYQSTSDGLDYCIWATLEVDLDGGGACFRACSDGKALDYNYVSGSCTPASIP